MTFSSLNCRSPLFLTPLEGKAARLPARSFPLLSWGPHRPRGAPARPHPSTLPCPHTCPPNGCSAGRGASGVALVGVREPQKERAPVGDTCRGVRGSPAHDHGEGIYARGARARGRPGSELPGRDPGAPRGQTPGGSRGLRGNNPSPPRPQSLRLRIPCPPTSSGHSPCTPPAPRPAHLAQPWGRPLSVLRSPSSKPTGASALTPGSRALAGGAGGGERGGEREGEGKGAEEKVGEGPEREGTGGGGGGGEKEGREGAGRVGLGERPLRGGRRVEVEGVEQEKGGGEGGKGGVGGGREGERRQRQGGHGAGRRGRGRGKGLKFGKRGRTGGGRKEGGGRARQGEGAEQRAGAGRSRGGTGSGGVESGEPVTEPGGGGEDPHRSARSQRAGVLPLRLASLPPRIRPHDRRGIGWTWGSARDPPGPHPTPRAHLHNGGPTRSLDGPGQTRPEGRDCESSLSPGARGPPWTAILPGAPGPPRRRSRAAGHPGWEAAVPARSKSPLHVGQNPGNLGSAICEDYGYPRALEAAGALCTPRC